MRAFLPVPVRNRNRPATNLPLQLDRCTTFGDGIALLYTSITLSPVELMLLIVAVIVLLPIVPAYLLFKLLPKSSAEVSGPLQGLEIKLGGAFAGYFILVVLILSQLTKLRGIAAPEPQVWKVTGTVLDSHGQPVEPLGANDVSFDPYILKQDRRGTFTATFAATPNPSGNGFDFPTLSLSHEAEYHDPIQLSQKTPEQLTRDEQNHTITLKPTRLLSSGAGDYQPAGAPPQATQPASPPLGGQHEP